MQKQTKQKSPLATVPPVAKANQKPVLAQRHEGGGREAEKIEKSLERSFPKRDKASGWRTGSFGVPVIGGKGLREGHAETRSLGDELHVRGTERLGSIGLNGDAVDAGDTMFESPLNPAAIGVRLPLLAQPYAKFEFTRVVLHYVGMISEANAEANGGLFMGANMDPDSATPQGDNGLDAMATWGPNVQEIAVYNQSRKLDLDLKVRKSQEPLFVDSTAEQRFSVQADLIVLAAQDFGAASQNFGQLFIEYEVRLFEINQSGALMNCIAAMASAMPAGATGNAVIGVDGAPSGFTKWIGDTSLTAPINYATTGANLQLQKRGVYVFTYWTCPVASASVTNVTTPPTLLCVDGCVQSSTVNQDFLNNPTGEYGNAAWLSYICNSSNNAYISSSGVSTPLASSGQPMYANTWTVVADAGATILIAPAVWNASYSSTSAALMTIMRVSPNTTDVMETRNLPTIVDQDERVVLSPLQYRNARKPSIRRLVKLDDKTLLRILAKIDAVRREATGDVDDAEHWNTLIRVLELPTPLFRVGATSMVVLPILQWLLRTLGPIVATKAISYLGEKLEHHGKKK